MITKKVLCINNDNTYLTLGKWYLVRAEDPYYYYIDGEFYYHKNCNNFITEQELRKQKLKKLNEKISK